MSRLRRLFRRDPRRVTGRAYQGWLSGTANYKAYRSRHIGRVRIIYSRRSRGNAMGRFGGGWQWKLGIQVARTELIINLLVSSVRITILPRCHYCEAPVRTGDDHYFRTDGEWAHVHKVCNRDIGKQKGLALT